MKTTAIGIVGAIFVGIAAILSQCNNLLLSIFFGVLSVLILLISLLVHRSESKKEISKPDLEIEMIPTPSFCSTFDSGLQNECVNIHRTAIILYLKITNIGNSSTQIGDIHVGYESMEHKLYWLTEEIALLDDFTMPMGDKKKVYPFLKQQNYLTENNQNTFLEPGQSSNGIVYFEQKASSANRYPKTDQNYKVKIKILVHNTTGQKWMIEEKITKVMIDAARKHCANFGKTRTLSR